MNLVKRAETAGFEALVVTIDTPKFGLRRADNRNEFSIPPHLQLANFTNDLATTKDKGRCGSHLSAYINSLFDDRINWDDVTWLKSVTKLPIVLKGIMTAEDAKIAIEYGASAILVSNHGARQLDSVPATIQVLPEITKAVNGRCDIFLDGGVTQGSDVFKALALGAKMVFIGRAALWGLAYNGKDGVKKVLSILREEFDNAMALSGCQSLSDINTELVVHKSVYNKL